MMYLAKKWLNEKNARLESIPSAFEKSVATYQRTLFSDLLKLLNLLQKDEAGNIIFNAGNLANISVIDRIHAELKESILNSEYVTHVDEYAKGFNVQADINDKYFKEVFEDFKPIATADATLALAKKGAAEALLGSPLESNFLTPIRSVLEDAVTSGASWGDTVQSIRDFVEGNEDADGRLLQYAKQIAKDEFSIADRSYTNAIADELDVEFYIYSGTEVLATRCFCHERKGKYFHYKEIEAWGRGENLGECDLGDGTWAGERAGTNGETIFQYAGGHNCNDTFMPVSVFAVPKDDVQRAIDAGLYSPTDAMLEQLGL